jgi:hypothetical protein
MKTYNVKDFNTSESFDDTSPPKDQSILDILEVHHSLWNKEEKINYRNKTYDIYTPEHQGFSSVILPNENDYNFLWITQNLNKSTYGTLGIIQSRSQGDDKRITWIVDNTAGTFKYVGVISTCDYFNGYRTELIERYTDEGTIVVYSSDPLIVSTRSKY